MIEICEICNKPNCMTHRALHEAQCPRCHRRCCPAGEDWHSYCETDVEETKRWILQWAQIEEETYRSSAC